MKMDTCSVRTMGGPLMGVDLVLGSLRPRWRGRKLELFDLLERVRRGFRLWCLRVFSLFGQMRMAGRELKPPSPPCNLFFVKQMVVYLIVYLCACLFNMTYS